MASTSTQTQSNGILFLNGTFPASFFFFIFVFSTQVTGNKCSIKVCQWLDLNSELWCRKRPLYQLIQTTAQAINGILGSLNTLYAKIPYLFVVASDELKISIKAFGQFYEHSTIVNYDASIEIYNRGAFITLVTSISHFQMPRHTWDYQKVVKS